MNRKTFVFILLIFLIGCGPYIYFKSPQPDRKKNLKNFPKSLIGTYISLNDSSLLIIDAKKIVKKRFENMFMPIDSFKAETGDTLIKDTSFIFTDNWHIKMKVMGDSIYVNSSREEDIFTISDEQLLRKFKGYYFLNFKDTNDLWRVELIKKTKDTLEFGSILTKEDLEQIKGITSVESYIDSSESGKTTKYYLNPARSEVRKILKYRTKGEKFKKL
jgi:hypothetical protein